MDKFNFQEPCCVERTLPLLLREYPLYTWQSNGDVTFEKIIKAVSHLAGSALEITLLLPKSELLILRVLEWYRRRGWLKSLTIVTTTDEFSSVRREFPVDFHVEIYFHKSITDSLLIINGSDGYAIVQGPLHALPATTPTVERFVTYVGNDKDQIAMLTATTTSRLSYLRRKAKKKEVVEAYSEEIVKQQISEQDETEESSDPSEESDNSDSPDTI